MNRIAHLMTIVCTAVICLGLLPSTSTAQQPGAVDQEISESAREHYERGLEHYEAGEYQEAADAFHRSYALTPAAMLLYNISMAQWRAGNIQAARVAAIRAAQAGLPPEVELKNEARLVALQSVLSTGNIVGDISAERAVSRRSSRGSKADADKESSADESPSDVELAGGEEPHVEDTGGGVLFWSGAGVTALGAASLGWALVLDHQVGTEADALNESGGDSNQQIVDRIESKQRLGVPLLIGGGAATLAGLTMMAFDLPGGTEASDDGATTWQVLPAGPGSSAGISITAGF